MSKFAVGTTTAPTLQSLRIEDFGGVDLTNSPLYVASNRATKMSNFIKENNVNQKRFGWREICQFPIIYLTDSNGDYILDNGGNKQEVSSSNINGVYEFDTSFLITTNGVNSYKKEHHIIVHVGKRFYRVSEFKDDSSKYTWLGSSTEITNELIANSENALIQDVRIKSSVSNHADLSSVLDDRSYGVASGNKLFLLCGDYLVYGSWDNGSTFELRKVYDDSETFIPTTTISILPTNTAYDTTQMTHRVAYDDVNMLSSFRKNTLLGNLSTDTDNQSNIVYYLDSLCSDTSTMVVKYNNSGTWTTLTLTTDYTVSTENGVSKLTILTNKVPVVSGADNIEVLFQVDNELESKKIRECKFGILYGTNGIRDRLFVSGNEEYPNYDWHSTETNNGNDGEQDLTYFSDLDYCKYGNTTNSIMGYEILGDGTLLVIKSASSQEPTIYTREANLITATSYDGTVITDSGGNAMYEEAYPLSVGNIGEGCINKSSICSLNGDTLILSSNGVFGIVLGDNVATSQRYAKERSRLINGELTTKDLENAVCITHESKYYICVDKKCYVADSRHCHQLADDLSNTYQYEWWVWDNIPARYMFSRNQTLYFGTDEGQICMFDNANFEDITYGVLSNGQITYNLTTTLFTVSPEHITDLESLHDKDALTLTPDNEPIYAKMLDVGDYEIVNGKIHITNGDISLSQITNSQNLDFYLDTITTSGSDLVVDTVYGIVFNESDSIITLTQVKTVNNVSSTISLVLDDNDLFRLCFRIPETVSICDVQDSSGFLYSNFYESGGQYYSLDSYGNIESELATKPIFNRFRISSYSEDGAAIGIVRYKNNATLDNYGGVIEFRQAVSCYYITPVFDLGTTIYSKNIQDLFITPDCLFGSRVEFGYETRKTTKEFSCYTGDSFDFGKLDFENISFESEMFAMTWHKRVRDKKVNFIQFIFKNSTADNCKINNLTMTYFVGKKNKGVN